MTTGLMTHLDLLDHEPVSCWRYDVRQREMLSVLNDIFDQFMPMSNGDGGLDADLNFATDTAEPQAESTSSRAMTQLRGSYCVSFAIRD